MRQTDKRAALRHSILGLAEPPERDEEQTSASRGIVGRALDVHKEGLLEKVARLEALREEEEGAGSRLLELDPALIREPLPADRDARSFADPAFAELEASIRSHGQDTPVTVRHGPDGTYELAAGRRRLAVCRRLGITVLARVLALDDEAMLALQYRENAERAEVSPFERGRWLLALGERQGRSTTSLARLLGLSQPLVVEYQKLARLPDELLAALADPRELTLADGRRLHKVLATDGKALERMLPAIEAAAEDGTRAQILAALSAASGRSRRVARDASLRGRIVTDRRGKKLVTVTRSGNQWVYRWAPDIDEAAVAFVADRLAALLEEHQP
jgi:ParB family transcriptional regulator, chromosome partitioning protein